jgi:hypothetical protein
MDEVNARLAASALNGNGGKPGTSPEAKAYSAAFDGFFRQGRDPDA